MKTRLSDFWSEFIKQFAWAEQPAKRVWQILGWVLTVLGLSAVAAIRLLGQYFADNPGALIWLSGAAWVLGPLAAAYVVWKIAVAWDRSAPPTIWSGRELTPDTINQMYSLLVKSIGKKVRPRVYVTHVHDAQEAWLAAVTAKVEIHARGIDPPRPIEIVGEDVMWAGILKFTPEPCLYALTETGEFSGVPLGSFVGQEEFRLTILIVFYGKDGNELKERVRRFTFIPNANAPMGYQAKSIA